MNYSSTCFVSAYQELNNIVRSTGRNALRRGQGGLRRGQGGLLSLIRLVACCVRELLETSGYPRMIYMFIRLPHLHKASVRTARLTKIGINVIWIQTRRTATGGFPNSCNLATNNISNSCQVTGRHIDKPKGPIVGHAVAIVENVEKGKEAPNWSLSCPKANGQQSEPEGMPTKRVVCESQERPK